MKSDKPNPFFRYSEIKKAMKEKPEEAHLYVDEFLSLRKRLKIGVDWTEDPFSRIIRIVKNQNRKRR